MARGPESTDTQWGIAGTSEGQRGLGGPVRTSEGQLGLPWVLASSWTSRNYNGKGGVAGAIGGKPEQDDKGASSGQLGPPMARVDWRGPTRTSKDQLGLLRALAPAWNCWDKGINIQETARGVSGGWWGPAMASGGLRKPGENPLELEETSRD